MTQWIEELNTAEISVKNPFVSNKSLLEAKKTDVKFVFSRNFIYLLQRL